MRATHGMIRMVSDMQRSKLLSRWLRLGTAAIALAVAGCGGGGSDDTILAPPDDNGGGSTGAVSRITLSTSSAQLPTSGSAFATITAVVQDANNVVVPGATVTFVADSGVLSAGSVASDEFGRAQTELASGGDNTPRTITVTASSEGVSESITVSIVDAQLVIDVPADTAHDAFNGNNAPRVMQATQDIDFQIEVKFDSGLSLPYQQQGIIIEQDSGALDYSGFFKKSMKNIDQFQLNVLSTEIR